MEKKVKDFIRKENLIEKGDRVLLGLSGGPDSVFLFHILRILSSELDFSLYTCHLNHSIRGSEADRDEEFSRNLSEEFNIPFWSLKADIPKISKLKGMGTEETAREERYRFFLKIKEEEGMDKIALAHNMNDQAETIIQRFLRGTGITGLKGIRPMRDDVFIRPALNISRKEIEEYLRENSFSFVTDSSNLTSEYVRNKIRHTVIPYVEENFNGSIVETLFNMGELMSLEDSFMEEEALKALHGRVTYEKGKALVSEELFTLHPALVKRALRQVIRKFTGKGENIYSVYINDILKIMEAGTGKSLDLPEGVKAENIYGKLCFSRVKRLKNGKEGNKSLRNDKINNTANEVSIKILREPQSVNLGKYTVTLWKSDFRGIKVSAELDIRGTHEVTLRTRRDGDRIRPLGMEGTKRVKSIFIDRKIPRDEREELPLLLSGEKIMYIHPGIVSEDFKVTEKTQEFLMVSVCKNPSGDELIGMGNKEQIQGEGRNRKGKSNK